MSKKKQQKLPEKWNVLVIDEKTKETKMKMVNLVDMFPWLKEDKDDKED